MFMGSFPFGGMLGRHCCNTFKNKVIIYFILIFSFHFVSSTSMQNEVKM